MERRRFLLTSLAGVLAAPLVAQAQLASKTSRVALVLAASPISELVGVPPAHPAARGLMDGLRALGYVEGQNLLLVRKSAEGRAERIPDIIRELVAMNVDVIVTNDFVAREARRVTGHTPIVMGISRDPVGMGLVASLARPGGNVTGLSGATGPEIAGKALQLLKEAVPRARRVALLTSRADWEHGWGEGARAAARPLGVAVLHVESSTNDLSPALAVIVRERPDALLAGTAPEVFANKDRIVRFALEQRLPLMHFAREFTEAGALLSYGPNIPDLFRRAATYVDRILKGASPGDLPVEQPNTFDVAINLRTAKALGLTIPPSLLQRADQVID